MGFMLVGYRAKFSTHFIQYYKFYINSADKHHAYCIVMGKVMFW